MSATRTPWMRLVGLWGLMLVATAGAADADPRPRVEVGETVTIRSRFADRPVVEPHVSAHPSDPDHLLVGAMVITDVAHPYQSARLSSFTSADGGTTWTETAHDWWGYDPWTVILPDGEAILSWIGTPRRFEHRFPLAFLSSDDGGVTWRTERQRMPGNHDGTKLAARGEEVIFTTVRFVDGGGADVVLMRRGDDGRFAEVTRVRGRGNRLNFCEPALLADGTAVVPASTFLERLWVHRVAPGSDVLGDAIAVTDRPGGAGGYIRLAVDTSAVSPYADHLYLVRAVGRAGTYEGIWLNVSTDGGRTWGPDVRVDRFPDGGGGGRAILATPAVNRDGVLAVTWVDLDPVGAGRDLHVAGSLDGGESFSVPVRVTEVGADPATAANGEAARRFPGGGHYLGLAARADGRFQAVWSDARSGHFELQTSTITVLPE